MFEWIADPNAWIALATLTALEIVLGVDNIIFISILSNKLPEDQQAKARTLGLAIALLGRIALLLSIAWIMRLTAPLFEILEFEFSGRDLILIAGGLFLLAKSTREIHDKLEGGGEDRTSIGKVTFGNVIFQIFVLDMVFSLDSVITAVGMVDIVPVMIIAIVIAVLALTIFWWALSWHLVGGSTSSKLKLEPLMRLLRRHD